MFRKKDPQGSLFETSNLVPASKVHRLQASWAEPFRVRGLPLIDEDLFAPLYCDDHGRPNRPVQTVFGVLLLKEMFGLTDAEALEQLEFNLLWHHALALTPGKGVYLKALACNIKRMVRTLMLKPGALSPAMG